MIKTSAEYWNEYVDKYRKATCDPNFTFTSEQAGMWLDGFNAGCAQTGKKFQEIMTKPLSEIMAKPLTTFSLKPVLPGNKGGEDED